MALASVALNSARSVYLNDRGKQIWSDTLLLPHLQEAYRDLVLALTLNGLSILKEKSSAITVNVGDTSLTLPADFYEPIRLRERDFSSSNPDDYIDMIQTDFPSDTNPDVTLRMWSYNQQVIKLIGATTKRSVLLFYLGGLTVPSSSASDLIFALAENFLAPQTAAYAAGSTGNLALASQLLYIPDIQLGVSGGKLSQIIRINVKNMQGLPVRRIPYHRAIRTKRSAF